jgi:hypothetical protein
LNHSRSLLRFSARRKESVRGVKKAGMQRILPNAGLCCKSTRYWILVATELVPAAQVTPFGLEYIDLSTTSCAGVSPRLSTSTP